MKDAIREAIVFLAFAASASAQIRAGGELRVNTYTTNTQQRARVAVEPDGDFVVVWESRLQDGSGDGVFAQRFDVAGVTQGGEFRVNTYTTSNQGFPAVSSDRKGNFVVVWNSYDGSGLGVFGRRYDAAGAPLGGEFQVNANSAGFQFYPNVAHAPDGSFVVVWDGPDGSGNGPFARRYDAAGNALGAEFQVNGFTTGGQFSADIEFDGSGNFVIVWSSEYQDGSSWGVFGRRYDAAGNPRGSEFQVNTYTTELQYALWNPLAVARDGSFVVTWRSFGQDGSGLGVFGRRYDAAGNALGADFQVSTFTTGNQYFPAIASAAHGTFTVAWQSYYQDGFFAGVFAQRYNPSGTPRGGEFRVNTYTTNYQGNADVGSDPSGNFVVTWNSSLQDGSGYGIFAQRFGGLIPTALAVDAAGNGVLEVGESPVVAPSWRNVNGAPQTFGGTLSNISGPAGGVYTITDANGNYGTVANGALQLCTDCYTVSVSAATRPAVHWDATALESITPDAQGQQKQWLLHVGGSFTDVPASSPFYRFIETLLHYSVTGGCGGTNYCPSTATTRDQMSVFVLVAKEGAGYAPPACGTPVFGDVAASSPFCRFIEELARRGVVSGCGGGNYCPTAAVTREQMSVFALRTLDPTLNPPACGVPMFADVPASSGFCKWIEELARRGVVSGCGGGNYCPTAAVTREQMGVFISATFALTLYGP